MKKVLSFLFLLCTISIIPVSMIAEDRIPMSLEKSGIYTIPCEVNGLKLRFVFDTGASDVHLSLVEAAFMLKMDTLKKMILWALELILWLMDQFQKMQLLI